MVLMTKESLRLGGNQQFPIENALAVHKSVENVHFRWKFRTHFHQSLICGWKCRKSRDSQSALFYNIYIEARSLGALGVHTSSLWPLRTSLTLSFVPLTFRPCDLGNVNPHLPKKKHKSNKFHQQIICRCLDPCGPNDLINIQSLRWTIL